LKLDRRRLQRKKLKETIYTLAKNIHFFPLVMETCGFMGNEFGTFTQKIESAFKRNRGKENLAAFKTAFEYDLSCDLQQGNAQFLQQGLIRFQFPLLLNSVDERVLISEKKEIELENWRMEKLSFVFFSMLLFILVRRENIQVEIPLLRQQELHFASTQLQEIQLNIRLSHKRIPMLLPVEIRVH
jgi:hypothetical protein